MSDIFDLFKQISRPKEPPSPVAYIVAGLGNPGKEYQGTRHNVGFDTVDAIASSVGVHIDRARFHALTAEGVIGGVRILFLKPLTYMNLSGNAVQEALAFYKLPPENLIVFCDDVSFDVGHVRLRRKGTHGGHNGLRNIIEMTGSENFFRIKIGVGKKPHPDYPLADWVLGHFSKEDAALLKEKEAVLGDALSLILQGKAEEAMNRYSK